MENMLYNTGAIELTLVTLVLACAFFVDKAKQYRRRKRLQATPYGRYILRKEGGANA